jgi:hypothetical protein
MYQLIMVLITISVFAGLLLAGRSYVDPQRVVDLERAELLLAESNRINLGLRAYRVANGVSASDPGWEDGITPYLSEPIRTLPDGLSWALRPGAEGGGVCLTAAPGAAVPGTAARLSCVLTGATACLSPSSVGLIGEPEWTGCAGMLIVDNGLLRSAGSAAIGGDESFALTGPDSESYTFTQSGRDVFTGQVTDFSDLFASTGFSGDIGYWSTSNAALMSGMFRSAPLFNAAIGGWDTSRVSGMTAMFEGATGFNRDLSGWCVPLIGAEPANFDTGATSWSSDRPVWGSCPSETTPILITLGAASLPDGERDTVYAGFDFTTALTVTGADPGDLTFASPDVPAGLSLSPAGALSGTPTLTGGFSFAVVASHPGGASDGRSYTIIINDPDPLIVEP